MTTLLALYHKQCQEGRINPDPAQEAVFPFFEQLRHELLTLKRRPKWFSWIGLLAKAPRGLYIWGEVGRGKTFLMDFFVASLPGVLVKRHHFHAFMQEVQQQLFALQKRFPEKDLFKILAQEIRHSADVLCLDEFFVDHIGDAMILSRLFQALFQEKIVLVTTSNIPPEKLYWNGLQRELLLPFLELLMQNVEVVQLKGAHDHRQDFLPLEITYLTPLGPATEKKLQEIWNRLTHKAAFEAMALKVKGHTLTLQRTAKGVCWVSFEALCGCPLGAADYLKLVQTFSVVILSDIPDLRPEHFNEAKRFITLVDLLYENRVPTVFSCAVPLAQLYRQGKGAKTFERTRSRLEEMQSWLL